jgi:hypothetical protein
VPSVPGDSPVFIRGTVPLRLADAAMDTAMYEVEPSGSDTYKRGGALPVAGTTPALANGTTGVKPTGKAEKATAARPEAWVSWAQDKAGHRHEVETPRQTERELKAQLQDGQCKPEALPRKGKCEVYEPPPEVLPPEGQHKLEAPL